MAIKTYHAIGLMSGSSLDGLDIAYCRFSFNEQHALLDWELKKGTTVTYTEQWINRLFNLPQQNGLVFSKTHTYFGHYMGEIVNNFIANHQIEPDFIASHGHTIYHYPDKRITVQIGDGAALAAITGYPVINNFRTQDIAINGEGTPLAPIADQYLLNEYDFFLNIGGIANITAKIDNRYIAFDIGPANQVLNALANEVDLPFDKGGTLAAKGNFIPDLLDTINKIPYFQQNYPKSLDNQWIVKNVIPIYKNATGSIEDKLNTACRQLALQIATSIRHILQKENLNQPSYKMVISGGGTFNDFLIKCIQEACSDISGFILVIPDDDIINFKEAILMALLGALRVENLPNCLASVTGADRNTIGGSIFQGWKKLI